MSEYERWETRFAGGDYAACVEWLRPVHRVAHRCGGSLAQCDIVHLTFTEAALRARRDRLARALVTERAARKPASQLNRLLQQRLQTIVPGQSPRQLGCLSSPDHGTLKNKSNATQSLLTAA